MLSFASGAIASPLAERIQQFPQWESKPSIGIAKGDLVYPDWMAGTWSVTSTLSQTPESDRFITTEISQQLFRSEKTIYLNEVETTILPVYNAPAAVLSRIPPLKWVVRLIACSTGLPSAPWG